MRHASATRATPRGCATGSSSRSTSRGSPSRADRRARRARRSRRTCSSRSGSSARSRRDRFGSRSAATRPTPTSITSSTCSRASSSGCGQSPLSPSRAEAGRRSGPGAEASPDQAVLGRAGLSSRGRARHVGDASRPVGSVMHPCHRSNGPVTPWNSAVTPAEWTCNAELAAELFVLLVQQLELGRGQADDALPLARERPGAVLASTLEASITHVVRICNAGRETVTAVERNRNGYVRQ